MYRYEESEKSQQGETKQLHLCDYSPDHFLGACFGFGTMGTSVSKLFENIFQGV